MGSIDHLNLEVMLDSGALISLLSQASVTKMTNTTEKPILKVLLRTASGMQLPVVNYVATSVLIQNTEASLQYEFFVVNDLITPAILGLDFLQQHGFLKCSHQSVSKKETSTITTHCGGGP